VPADVSEEKACKSLIEKTISEFDQLDVLVNNAGRTMWTTLENMVDISIIEQLMRINYFSAAYCTSYESQKPSIEFVGSKLCWHIYYIVMIPLVFTKIVVD